MLKRCGVLIVGLFCAVNALHAFAATEPTNLYTTKLSLKSYLVINEVI